MADYLAIARRALAGSPERPRSEANPAAKNFFSPPAMPQTSVDGMDDWGFPLAIGEQSIDPTNPCERCGRLEKWWSGLGQCRCLCCDPPALQMNALPLRNRHAAGTNRQRSVPKTPYCRRCHSTQFTDTKIHGGRSIRRDCAQCGLTAGFPMWWGRLDERFAED